MNKATTNKLQAIRRRLHNAQTQPHHNKALIEELAAKIEAPTAEDGQAGDSNAPEDEQECNYVKNGSYVRYGNDKRSMIRLGNEEFIKRTPAELREKSKGMLLTYPELVDDCVEKYKETHNPLYLWEAIGYSMTADVPLPMAVRDYLIECANGLFKGLPSKQALKLNGRGHESPLEHLNRRNAEYEKVCAYRFRLPGFETQEKAAATLNISERWFSKIISRRS